MCGEVHEFRHQIDIPRMMHAAFQPLQLNDVQGIEARLKTLVGRAYWDYLLRQPFPVVGEFAFRRPILTFGLIDESLARVNPAGNLRTIDASDQANPKIFVQRGGKDEIGRYST